MNKEVQELRLATLPLNENHNHDDWRIFWFKNADRFSCEFDHMRSCVKFIDSIEMFQNEMKNSNRNERSIFLVTQSIEHLDFFLQQPQISSVYILNESSCPISTNFESNRVFVFSQLSTLMQRIRRDMILMYRGDLVNGSLSTDGIDIQNSFIHLDSYGGLLIWNLLFINQLVRPRNHLDMNQLKKTLVERLRIEYRSNPVLLEKVRDFEREDVTKNVLQWYTGSSFIHQPMNKAFRSRSPELIREFRYFLILLHNELEKLWREQRDWIGVMSTVYRSQSMTKEQLEKLKRQEKNLISITTAFSTSCKRNIVESFATTEKNNRDEVSVLLEITMGDTTNSIRFPFAFIGHLSMFPEEEEVLFFPGTIFRLESIRKEAFRDRWIIQLTHRHEPIERLNICIVEIEKHLSNGYTRDIDRVMNSESDLTLFEKYFFLLTGRHNNVEELLVGRLGLVCIGFIKRFGQYQSIIDYFQQQIDDEEFMRNYSKEKRIILTILIAKNYFYLNDFDQALNYYAIALLTLDDENHQITGEIRSLRGDAESAKNNLSDARDEYEEAIRIYRRCQVKGRFIARIYQKLENVYRRRDQHQAADYCKRQAEHWAPPVTKRSESNALKSFEDYAKLLTTDFQVDSFPRGNLIYEQALAAVQNNNLTVGLRLLFDAKDVFLRNMTDYQPFVHLFATLYETLAFVNFRLNDFDEALIYWKRAIDIRRGFLPN